MTAEFSKTCPADLKLLPHLREVFSLPFSAKGVSVAMH